MVEWRRPWIGVQSASSATSFHHFQRFLQRYPCYFGDMRIITVPFVHEEFSFQRDAMCFAVDSDKRWIGACISLPLHRRSPSDHDALTLPKSRERPDHTNLEPRKCL